MDEETKRIFLANLAGIIGAFVGLVSAIFAGIAMLRTGRVEVKQKELAENVDGKLATLIEAKIEIGDIKEKLGEATGFIAGLKNGEIPVAVQEPSKESLQIDEPLKVELVDGHEPKDVKER